MSRNVHRWTMEEDEICCRRFLECYVIDKSSLEISQFLKTLEDDVPGVSRKSLRMKFQNIKCLTALAGLEDSSALKWLSGYSRQNKKVFDKALEDLGIAL